MFSYEGTPFKASTIPATGLSPVYRFFNLQNGVHFYTINEVERAGVVANLPHMSYEGVGWYSYASPAAGTTALYRFFNTQTGAHFYTINISERDNVIANLKQYNYEGILFLFQSILFLLLFHTTYIA